MMISIIVAMDEKGGIGVRSALPWRLSTDLRRFRKLTMGHHLIVGRKTFEAIGRPLAGRRMIVVTRNQGLWAEGPLIALSFDQALELARQQGEGEVFVIGGAMIYLLALPRAQRIYLTLVHTQVEADTYFPPINTAEWVVSEETYFPAGAEDQYAHTFRLLERVG